MSTRHERFLNEVALGTVTTTVFWQCVPYIDYTMPVCASNKNRIAQRFAQLLTMTTCVSAANWKNMSKSTSTRL